MGEGIIAILAGGPLPRGFPNNIKKAKVRSEREREWDLRGGAVNDNACQQQGGIPFVAEHRI